MKFSELSKSLEVIKSLEALIASHLEVHQMELGSHHTDLLPDGSIQVHALVSDAGCDCLQYVLIRIDRGPDDQLDVHPPVAARD